MTFDAKALLISVQEAHRLHQAGGVHFLDATYFASSEPLKAADEYAAGHLPGAAFFAIEAIADHSNPLPHMLPPLAEGEAALRALGVNNADLVVVYDRPRLRSAPRVWWMLRYFGHQNVVVLDGGYAAWVEAGCRRAI